MGFVIPCNIGAPGACGERGEIIYLRALQDMPSPGTDEDNYALEDVPRAIAHETIHLSQLTYGWQHGTAFFLPSFPRFFYEGQAQLFGLTGPAAGGQYGDETPLTSPYVLGGVFFWWLRDRYSTILTGNFSRRCSAMPASIQSKA